MAAYNQKQDVIPIPKDFIHSKTFGKDKLLNDFLARLKQGLIKSFDDYSPHVLKYF